MHNIVTIYRFRTPFVNIQDEKVNLKSVIKKVENSLEFDWIVFKRISSYEWDYYKISLLTPDNITKVDFYYVKKLDLEYFFPIFKLNIFISNAYLVWSHNKYKLISFLNNIFECFDWLNEKEFLIDIDNSVYYKKSFFSSKLYPNYDFYDIDDIQKNFEEKEWFVLIKDFINKFSNKTFILDLKSSAYYHKLHSIFLYFIYLVFLMHQNIKKTSEIKKELEEVKKNWIYEWNIVLFKKRLSYIENLHSSTFIKYKNRLELFFKLF